MLLGNMPPRQLSADEEVLVDSIVSRKLRFLTLAHEHASAARSSCTPDIFDQACDEASRALEPKTGREIIYPSKGTNMEEYYQKFEPALTTNAQTPFEHMFIAKTAMGLNAILVNCEYGCLPEHAQYEVDIRFTRLSREYINRKTPAVTKQPSQITATPQRLLPRAILPPIDQSAQLIQLQPVQVDKYLRNFAELHHRIFWDADSCECYKVVGVNYSRSTPSIDSYEVQLQQSPYAFTCSFEDVKQMLLRSSMVVV